MPASTSAASEVLQASQAQQNSSSLMAPFISGVQGYSAGEINSAETVCFCQREIQMY